MSSTLECDIEIESVCLGIMNNKFIKWFFPKGKALAALKFPIRHMYIDKTTKVN
jgi:hypothetical protein